MPDLYCTIISNNSRIFSHPCLVRKNYCKKEQFVRFFSFLKLILIDLINVLLPESRSVKDISYATTEIPGFSLSNKSVRLDLRCTGDEGSEFIVEMQCYRQDFRQDGAGMGRACGDGVHFQGKSHGRCSG